MDFSHYKKIRLLRPDYSRAGEIDLPIQKLCVTINNYLSFATLSSCAGRMCLLEFATPGKKQKTAWLIKTHALIQAKQIWKTVKKYKGKKKVFFLSEPPILHIAAATLPLAHHILTLGREAGFKRSGLLSLGTYPVVELASTEVLAIPIIDKKLLITEQYLNYLVKEGNNNIKKGWEKIKKIERLLQKLP